MEKEWGHATAKRKEIGFFMKPEMTGACAIRVLPFDGNDSSALRGDLPTYLRGAMGKTLEDQLDFPAAVGQIDP